ncbi:hypothetical protein PSPO01_16056 [Paraphaeosphaeria sporulosa]
MSGTAPSFDLDAQSELGAISIKPGFTNKTTGGSGGTKFKLINEEHHVKKIEVWTDTGSNTKDGNWSDRQLIKDIELTWDDNTSSNITGNQSGDSVDFIFKVDEKVTSMTIRTGARVDKISFVTNKKEDDVYLAQGILYGFHGYYNETKNELISLGAKFKS